MKVQSMSAVVMGCIVRYGTAPVRPDGPLELEARRDQ